MEFTQNGNKYFVRLEKGEEIVASLQEFCLKNNIKAGFVTGIGAIKSMTVGFFNPETKEYHARTFEEYMEITSLLGNISEKEGKPYLHLHIMATGGEYKVLGGHLSEAFISATGEICVIDFGKSVGRKFSEEIGLNLLNFS